MSKETNMSLFNTFGFKGLELRDYFAAKVLQAFLMDKNLTCSNDAYKLAVKGSYVIADQMLKEREIER